VSFLSSRRSRPQPDGDAEGPLVVDEAALKAYPSVLSFLGADRYGDGTARERGTITFFADSTELKAAINDKDGEASAYVTGKSFKGILDVLDRKLTDDTLDWRAWKKKALPRRK